MEELQANTAAASKIKGAPKKQVIEVDKEKLDGLIDRLEKLEKDNAMLVATADKARVARFNDLNAVPQPHTYRVRLFKGQVVVGWRSVLDEMYQDSRGLWHEQQQVEIVTADGNKYTLPFLESERLQKIQTTHVSTDTKSENGQTVTVLTLRREDTGDMISIDSNFVN